MPVYEYKCRKCNLTFSVLQKTGFSEKETVCPECGSQEVKKLLSAFFSSSAHGHGDALLSSMPAKSYGGG